MLFRLMGTRADRIDANRSEVLSMAVRFLILFAALLLENDYFSTPAVFNNRSAYALACDTRSADIHLIAVRRKKSFEFDRCAYFCRQRRHMNYLAFGDSKLLAACSNDRVCH